MANAEGHEPMNDATLNNVLALVIVNQDVDRQRINRLIRDVADLQLVRYT